MSVIRKILVFTTTKKKLYGGTLENSFGSDAVKFLLEPPSVFLNNDDTLRNKSDTMMMDDISSFIADHNINPSRKSDFIAIMASLVDLSPLSAGEKKIGDNWRSVIASNVLGFANGSRIHEGERLCQRTVCHAMDPTTPTMMQSTISFATYKDQSVIISKNKVS